MINHTESAETFSIGGDLTVQRLGFGAMRITGEGIWGEPADPEEAKLVLKRAIELGVNFIDTADAYGPYVSERLIGETLAPYPEGVVIATKVGLERSGSGEWSVNAKPEHIREAIEGSLERLKLTTIDLYQLHRIDPDVPLEETINTLKDLQSEGKIKHIGLSEVSIENIKAVSEIMDVATVQNRYNLTDREHQKVLDYCTEKNIGFIPWYPLATGDLAKNDDSALSQIAEEKSVSPSQIALAWLLHVSPVVLPIPGTSSVDHLEENVAAKDIILSEDEMRRLNALVDEN